MAGCRRSVCLFGLSADPPTGYEGHVGIVQALQNLNEWHEIWVIPVYRHAFSDKRRRLISFEHRWKMCELAFSELSCSTTMSTKIVISDAEYQTWKYVVRDISDEDERDKISVGTASLLDYLLSTPPTTTGTFTAEENPLESIDYSFCLGADAFLDLTAGKWKESARVLQYFSGRKLVVLHRSIATSTGGSTSSCCNDMDTSGDATLLELVEQTGARLIRIGTLGGISSSQVRDCPSMETLRSMVSPKVAEYIQTNQLYRFSRNTSESVER